MVYLISETTRAGSEGILVVQISQKDWEVVINDATRGIRVNAAQ